MSQVLQPAYAPYQTGSLSPVRLWTLNDDVSVYSDVVASGYLTPQVNLGHSFNSGDLVYVNYSGGQGLFSLSLSGLIPTLAPAVLLNNAVNAGQSMNSSVSSATPGTVRALLGKMSESASVMTSGNLVGVRGEVDYVGASGGFLYGLQGKLIPSGTLSGSSWNAPVFGQFDISAATVNAGQTACIWGDYGATSGTISDASGMRGIAMTNTTAAVLNSQDYRYGNAAYLWELAGAGGTLNYYLDAGTSSGSAGDASHCAAQKVLKIQINGSAAYVPVFTQNT